MILVGSVLCAIFGLTAGQDVPATPNLHIGLSEAIGNFSVELLYRAAHTQNANENLVISPMTVWTVLAVIAEGAFGKTKQEVQRVARLGRPEAVRADFAKILQYLVANTSTVELARINCIFLDQTVSLERDFQKIAVNHYATIISEHNFKESEKTAKHINERISKFTKNRINNVLDSNSFNEVKMLLMSALYFRGQWKSPFNASSTEKRPFYNDNGELIGQVNMMYNRATYPFANIKELQARIIELPYGEQNRLSMLIMLPNPKVSLEQMIHNLKNVTLDNVFAEMKRSVDEFADDEVDCLIPRFKIESNLNLIEPLVSMGIIELFKTTARLDYIARFPMYVSKVIHKAEIEVTEEGTTASAVTIAEFANRISAIRFEANRPFVYLIVEKMTNSITFGGIYQKPSLY